MDDIVRQAMAKWPNVPHCYGWLALDARGAWRMRDERAQALGLAGERITHPALLGFINRNYGSDAQGRWYFQNGPQRVYVDLDATPHIARSDPEQGFLLQTGQVLQAPDAAWLCDDGQLLLRGKEGIAQLDDRDLAQALAGLRLDGRALEDEALLALLEQEQAPPGLAFACGAALLPLQRIRRSELAQRFGFVARPRPA